MHKAVIISVVLVLLCLLGGLIYLAVGSSGEIPWIPVDPVDQPDDATGTLGSIKHEIVVTFNDDTTKVITPTNDVLNIFPFSLFNDGKIISSLNYNLYVCTSNGFLQARDDNFELVFEVKNEIGKTVKTYNYENPSPQSFNVTTDFVQICSYEINPNDFMANMGSASYSVFCTPDGCIEYNNLDSWKSTLNPDTLMFNVEVSQGLTIIFEGGTEPVYK